MASFICRNSRVSNFKSFSWMQLLLITWTVISSASFVPSLPDYMTLQRKQRRSITTSSASNVPSLSDYMTLQRRQRRSIMTRSASYTQCIDTQQEILQDDQWIPKALCTICPWAECNGWIGCSQSSNPTPTCSSAPENFVERRATEVPPGRRKQLGTCYGYSPPGNRAPNDRCKDGPKKDECACIKDDRTLRIGYRVEGKSHPQYDAPIRELCERIITSHCTTTPLPSTHPTTAAAAATPPPTKGFTNPTSTTGAGPTEVSTGLLTSSTLTPSTTATTTAMPATNRSTTPVVPTGLSSSVETGPITGAPSVVTKASTSPKEEGSNGVQHFLIWPPLLIALIVICLLVALYRRRRRSSKTSAGVSVSFSAVNGSDSPTTSQPSPNDVTVSNPSYERHVSGNELDRSGDFFCPLLDTIPRTPNSGRGRPIISPGLDGDEHGKNAAAVHGHFNVFFSDGNYSDVHPDVSDEKLALSSIKNDLPQYEPTTPGEVRYNPVDAVPASENRGSSGQPRRNVQTLSADGYEDAPVFSFANDRRDASSAYETATAGLANQQDGNHQQPYTTRDNLHPREQNARPGADLHYEAVSPPGHSPKSTGGNVYAYATTIVYPSCLNTPGGPQIVNDNKYNVLQTPVKENDGEYSMLKRSIGGSDSTSPHVPIVVSSNEYNKLAVPLIKQ